MAPSPPLISVDFSSYDEITNQNQTTNKKQTTHKTQTPPQLAPLDPRLQVQVQRHLRHRDAGRPDDADAGQQDRAVQPGLPLRVPGGGGRVLRQAQDERHGGRGQPLLQGIVLVESFLPACYYLFSRLFPSHYTRTPCARNVSCKSTEARHAGRRWARFSPPRPPLLDAVSACLCFPCDKRFWDLSPPCMRAHYRPKITW